MGIFKKEFLKIGISSATFFSPIFFLINKSANHGENNLNLTSDKEGNENNENLLKIGTNQKKLSDLLKEYLKTNSGAKNLSEKFVQIFILNFLNSLKNEKYSNSTLKEEFQNLLSKIDRDIQSSWENLSSSEKEEALKMFAGDEDNYKHHQKILGLKEKFLEQISSQNTLNVDGEEKIEEEKFREKEKNIKIKESSGESKKESAKDEISFENTSNPDTLKQKISKFLHFVFEDFVSHEKPITFKKLTWKYDESKSSEKFNEYSKSNPEIKKILPEYTNYFFPGFSETTEQNFLKFLKKYLEYKSNESTDEQVEKYSDVEQTEFIVPISQLNKNEYSSQFKISLLNFYSDFSKKYELQKKEEEEDKEPETFSETITQFGNFFSSIIPRIKKNFESVKKTLESIVEKINPDNENEDDHCIEKNLDNIGIVHESPDEKKNQNFLPIFCFKNTENTDQKYQPNGKLKDFFMIDGEKKWIVYRDKYGFHAIGENNQLNEKYSLQEIKKLLLIQEFKRQNNFSDASKYKFNLFSEMQKHLKKNFDRLILTFYEQLLENSENAEKTKYENLIKKLTNLLLVENYSKYSFEIKKSLIKDYVEFSSFISKKPRESGKFQIDPSVGFAGKFPYKLNYSTETKPKDYTNGSDEKDNGQNEREFLIENLEKIYADSYKIFETEEAEEAEEAKKTSNLLPNLKTIFTEYSSEIDTFFSSNVSSLTIEAKNYKNKKTLHFKNTANDEKLVPKIPVLIEQIWIESLKNKDIKNLLIQQNIQKEIEKYFKFDEKKYQTSEDVDSNTNLEIFGNKKKSENDEKLVKEIIKNYLIEKNLKTFLSFPVPHIFGNWKYEKDKEDESLYELFQAIEYQQKYIYSTKGFNLIGNENKNLFSELFTIHWLVKNKFENLRTYFKEKVKKHSFDAFLFLKSYEKEKLELCEIKNEAVTEENLSDFKFKKNINNTLYSPYMTTSDNKTSEDIECGNIGENYNFSRIIFQKNSDSQENNDSKILTGYKGMLSDNIISNSIMEIIKKDKVLWKKFDSITHEIKNTKTFSELETLIEQLKKQFHEIDWSLISLEKWFNKEKFNFDWRNPRTQAINLKKDLIPLEERKKILINYLKNQKEFSVDENVSWSYIKNKQEEFLGLNEVNGDSGEDSNLIKQEKFKDFFGSIHKNNNYLLIDDKNNSLKIFLIQVKYEDFETSEAFEKFLKTIHSDLILKEVSKIAQNASVQRKAILEKLLDKNDDSNKIEKFEIYDERLKDSIQQDWIN